MNRVNASFLVVERWLVSAALFFSLVSLSALVVCCFYQIVSRSIFHLPLAWSEALVRVLMLWSVFLALPAAFREGAMISIDFLPQKLGANRAIVVIPLAGLSLFLLLVLVIYGTDILGRVRFQKISGLGVSMVWAYLAIPIGAGISALAVLAGMLRAVTDRRLSRDEGVAA